jgi:osmotically inducible protein OsmC
MATDRRAEVTWNGDLMSGSGTIQGVGSGAFGPLDVTWASRAEEPAGKTSPEELIAAAHAACFSMALSHGLAEAGHPPEQLSVTATVTFEPGTGITKSALDVEGSVPGVDDASFREAAEAAKDGCPVSGAMKGNLELSVSARLRNG